MNSRKNKAEILMQKENGSLAEAVGRRAAINNLLHKTDGMKNIINNK